MRDCFKYAACLTAALCAAATRGDMPPDNRHTDAPNYLSNGKAVAARLRILFIHHSCGGQLLADPGPEKGEHCIYSSHPNGGGLRRLLEKSGFELHEASYGSKIGAETDVFDWLPKFRSQMDEIITCTHQDDRYPDDRRNQIVVFKSCYPNNLFVSEGSPPGDPDVPELTIWNAKAVYTELLGEFRKRPNVLFVCLTAPPAAPELRPEPLWKSAARAVLGRSRPSLKQRRESAALARRFNSWLSGRDGWLSGYRGRNVAVFDYYDILTGYGRSDFSVYPTRGGWDSHPNGAGNVRAAKEFVPFLIGAVRRVGLGVEDQLPSP